MLNIRAQASLIEKTIMKIATETIPDLQSTKSYLETLYERINASLNEHGMREADPFVDEAFAETFILYANVVCDYYKNLLRFRPMTQEEKEIGDRLRKLMLDTMTALKEHIQSRERKP